MEVRRPVWLLTEKLKVEKTHPRGRPGASGPLFCLLDLPFPFLFSFLFGGKVLLYYTASKESSCLRFPSSWDYKA